MSDRETMHFADGWSAYKAGARWWFCRPDGVEAFHVDPGLCEPEFQEFFAAMNTPALAAVSPVVPEGLGELAELSAKAPQGGDAKRIAKSLALAITEWINGGTEWGYDWRPGLERVIRLRLQRLNEPSAAPESEQSHEAL